MRNFTFTTCRKKRLHPPLWKQRYQIVGKRIRLENRRGQRKCQITRASLSNTSTKWRRSKVESMETVLLLWASTDRCRRIITCMNVAMLLESPSRMLTGGSNKPWTGHCRHKTMAFLVYWSFTTRIWQNLNWMNCALLSVFWNSKMIQTNKSKMARSQMIK